MVHRYPTRFQAKLRAAQEKEELNQTVSFCNGVLTELEGASCLHCKVSLTTTLFEHLYENPILLTRYESFRATTWKKMNETEQVILTELTKIPSSLTENNKYAMNKYATEFRAESLCLLNLLEKVRRKYW